MPLTPEAAAATDLYRAALVAVRDRLARVVTTQFRAIDLDGDIDRQIAVWTGDATQLVLGTQADAARMTSRYLSDYLAAAGLASSGGLDRDHTGTDSFGRDVSTALRSAPVAMLWTLQQRRGRTAAVAAGAARATAVTRDAVMGAARSAASDHATSEPAMTGWRRVTSSRPCGGCLAAADGDIHPWSRPLRSHDSCRCTAEPVIADLPERVVRPTGQQLFDRLDPAAQAALFAGQGGAEKAAVVRNEGVQVLADQRGGRLAEAALTDL